MYICRLLKLFIFSIGRAHEPRNVYALYTAKHLTKHEEIFQSDSVCNSG